ncbi:hypothetical protein BsWGS_00010 [Bradybaena similaris]
MADDEHQAAASPPLPRRGAYNIDFDALDESSNPFEPKVKLGSSPPHTVSALPAVADDVDPFKSRKTLACSPPGSPKISKSANNIGDDGMQADAESSPSVDGACGVHSAQSSDNIRDTTQVTPKKKKIVKKPKLQSKIRAPKCVRPPQEESSDVPGTGPPEQPETVDSESLPAPRKQPLPRKKIKSHDLDESSVKEDEPHVETANVASDGAPCEAASEAMASSSEIDHQFVENDDLEDPEHGKTRAWPAKKAADDGVDSSRDGSFSDVKEDKRLSQLQIEPPHHVLLSGSDLTSPATGSASKHSSSPDTTNTAKSRHEVPVVITPPQGKPSEGSSSKHPASRALAAARADNSLQVLDSKKASTEMERGSSQDDGGDSKGAVVQLVQVLRYSQSDWNKLKQDLELNFQASLLNKERDWSLMLAERDKKIAALEETNRKVKHSNEEMRMIVSEFEKTISQLQAEKEKTKTDSHKAVQNLESERDQVMEDLQSVETAFSDLLRRYEKSKSIIEGFKRNEEQLKQCVEDLQTKLKKSEIKLQALRSQAEDKLDKANEDIEKIKKSTKSDIVRLEAALKKAELRISGLEESLQRKEKENQELTAICDELIAKVGS